MTVFKKLFKGLLAIVVVFSLFLFISIMWPLSEASVPSKASALLVKNVQVVDVSTGEVSEQTNIFIDQGIIQKIAKDAVGFDGHIVDGQGQYVIPGLFDMHFHSTRFAPYIEHPLTIAAGVTAVRDMGGCLDDYDAWAACAPDKRLWHVEATNGERAGPKYDQITSLAINGGAEIPSSFDQALGAGNAIAARVRVEHDVARGIDFLKPYSDLTRDAYFALADAAKQRNSYLAGHLPFSVTGFEAIKAGQKSIEHALLFIWECYPSIDDMRALDNPFSVYDDELRLKMIKDHDQAFAMI